MLLLVGQSGGVLAFKGEFGGVFGTLLKSYGNCDKSSNGVKTSIAGNADMSKLDEEGASKTRVLLIELTRKINIFLLGISAVGGAS